MVEALPRQSYESLKPCLMLDSTRLQWSIDKAKLKDHIQETAGIYVEGEYQVEVAEKVEHFIEAYKELMKISGRFNVMHNHIPALATACPLVTVTTSFEALPNVSAINLLKEPQTEPTPEEILA